MPFRASLLSVVLLYGAGCAPQRQAAGTYASDSWITTKVNSALLADPQVSGMAIQVETLRGTVQLSGFVDSYFQKNHAAEIARSIDGVKEVKNDIRLK
jgi:osmotically-inducible protein OsmY